MSLRRTPRRWTQGIGSALLALGPSLGICQLSCGLSINGCPHGRTLPHDTLLWGMAVWVSGHFLLNTCSPVGYCPWTFCELPSGAEECYKRKVRTWGSLSGSAGFVSSAPTWRGGTHSGSSGSDGQDVWEGGKSCLDFRANLSAWLILGMLTEWVVNEWVIE